MNALPCADRRPQKVALLVGSNPLPNYLAAMVLSPQEVVLLHSPETVDPRDYLQAALSAKEIKVTNVCIDDVTNARKIRDVCTTLRVDHLHYSGGTKPMAAHARAAVGLTDMQASYLDERCGLLRFDDGYDVKLSDRELDLTTNLMLALHGVTQVESDIAAEGGPSDIDVDAVSARMLSEPDLARKLFEHFRPNGERRSVTKAKGSPWKASDYGLVLTSATIPDTEWTKKQYKAWDDFLGGEWLEHWTANIIRNCLDAPTTVEVDVKCKRSKPVTSEFQIDVALIRNQRIYVVSCTTEREKKAVCKSKLFEVAMRARQMGGDLARCALVCLLDGNDTKGTYVDQLRADIASVWDAPNVPRVFGLADLREWAGTSSDPNLCSLKEWLDS